MGISMPLSDRLLLDRLVWPRKSTSEPPGEGPLHRIGRQTANNGSLGLLDGQAVLGLRDDNLPSRQQAPLVGRGRLASSRAWYSDGLPGMPQ